ncbi:hypothetical protein WR25_22481 isoform C [Diploscapter pachys]|uniref:Ras-GAP domain-containing protein n=1 Tax=Diploscapter pachys TaxID=2018661 RepID=A0A2A2JHY9_9BILA|nr:hypothetical protein WR25_22481 isoform C [Diploscapter pachys]
MCSTRRSAELPSDYNAIPLTVSSCYSELTDGLEFSNTAKKSNLLKALFRTVKVKKNYIHVSSIFGNYCRYTVTPTTETQSNRLATALGAKSNKDEQPSLRIKARWQTVEILPMRAYDELLQFLTYNYMPLCTQLEPILSVKAKEDFATSIVRILHKKKLAKEFLCDLIMVEVDALDNDHLMFRGNSLATKAMEAYMKLVADDYLQSTLGDFIRNALRSEDSCEVDPLKLNNPTQATLEKNRQLLMNHVELAWGKIIQSTTKFPSELVDVFASLRQRLESQERGGLADTLISSSIFLRYLCPAILSPSLFSIVSEYPSGATARNLTLIAKTLQNLANFTKFGGKEHYMEFMNEFVEREWQRMKDFLRRISTGPIDRVPTDVVVDLGKELSLLNTYLDEMWTDEVHSRCTLIDKHLIDLRGILIDLAVNKGGNAASAQNANGGPAPVIHQTSSDYDNSPNTPVGNHRDSRNQNVPAYRATPPNGQALVMSNGATPNQGNAARSSRVATDLSTNDDYVLSSAIQTTPHRHHLTRLSDETGTSSSRTSEKTTSSGDVRDDDTDSEPDEKPRNRIVKGKRQRGGMEAGLPINGHVAGSPSIDSTSMQPASSGYHTNNHSSYSNSSSSSSPIERSSALSALSAIQQASAVANGYGNAQPAYAGDSPSLERPPASKSLHPAANRTASYSNTSTASSSSNSGKQHPSHANGYHQRDREAAYHSYQRRPSPPPYDSDIIHGYHYQPVYAVPPDCEISPRSSSQTMPGPGSKASLTRTNPRQMRQNPANGQSGQTGQTPLRPTVIDVMPENWERYISFNF